MAQVWRIVKEKYADSAFSGEGARRAGGRFNSPGRPVVYTSASLALAELEILVNLPTDRLLASYVAFRAHVPDAHMTTLDRAALPDHWRTNPAPQAVRALGDEWLQAKSALALRVPSAVVPRENNVLLNPEHPNFENVTVEGPLDPDLDDRLT
jgi:RES domain-containing protein